MWILLAILFPVAVGWTLMLLHPADRRRRQDYVMGAACATAAFSMTAIFSCRGDDPLVALHFSESMSIAFQIDGLSVLFAGMVSLLWPVACLYALEYMSREGRENRFFCFYLVSFGVTLGIAFSANIVTLYLFYELLTLVTLPLVMHGMDGKARYAGKVYLLYAMSGAALSFLAMVFLIQYGGGHFRLGGSLGMLDQSGRSALQLAYVLGFFGFGVKAAVFPGYKWLLRASVAPTPVTALLHAVAVVKSGVFAITRLTWYGFGPEVLAGSWAQTLVMGAAVFTIVFGSVKALRTQHLKRRLAFSTVSNLSYILLGITLMTPAGLHAAMLHMVFHAVIKITLFFCVGAVHYKLHRDFTADIEGCGPLMPVVFGCFSAASLGLMGVPPLPGFTSKWLLAVAAVGQGSLMGYLGAAALALSALLTALYLMQIVMLAFFPRQNRQISVPIPKRARRDPGRLMTGPLVALSVAVLALGLGSGRLLALITELLQ